MSSMDEYARKQVIMDNLEASLRDLHRSRLSALDELIKINKQIQKHVDFLKKLKESE